MYSLRRTLAVRFSLTMFVALLLIALWAFLGAQRTLHRQLDQGLASALALETDVVASGAAVAPHVGGKDMAAFVAQVNRFVVLRDASGHVVSVNTPLAVTLSLDQESRARAQRGEAHWTTERWGKHSIRSVYGPAPAGSGPAVAGVQVAASLAPLAAESRRMLFLLLSTVLLGTVATAFGAAWLAGSAVAPVDAITGQAESIRAGVVGQRITAHADVEEFQGLVRVLNGMLERLDRAFQAQRRIIADVGHDLRTPITAVRGEVEVALRGERSAQDYRATLASVLEECERLSAISEALILLARIEAGQITPRPAPVDVAELAASAVQRIQLRADSRTVRFQRRGDQDAVTLADPEMLGLVLDHLLDNAVRHTPPSSEVEASVQPAASEVIVRIRDNGPGIGEESLPHLFERFYRADAARSRGPGPGLGLTVAAAIVDAHGGTITAANVPAGGLEVTLNLPRSAAKLF